MPSRRSQTFRGPSAGHFRPFSADLLSWSTPRKQGQSRPALRVPRSGIGASETCPARHSIKEMKTIGSPSTTYTVRGRPRLVSHSSLLVLAGELFGRGGTRGAG